MELNFRELAREFCREKDFPNVDLIEAAMQKAAASTLAQTTERLAVLRAQMVEHRERNNAPR